VLTLRLERQGNIAFKFNLTGDTMRNGIMGIIIGVSLVYAQTALSREMNQEQPQKANTAQSAPAEKASSAKKHRVRHHHRHRHVEHREGYGRDGYRHDGYGREGYYGEKGYYTRDCNGEIVYHRHHHHHHHHHKPHHKHPAHQKHTGEPGMNNAAPAASKPNANKATKKSTNKKTSYEQQNWDHHPRTTRVNTTTDYNAPTMVDEIGRDHHN
jgi:hypothetical protein